MTECDGSGSVLDRDPFKFGVLWALFFVSFFFLDGKSQDGTENVLIMWAGIYLMLSSGTLLFVYWFHGFMHRHDRRNYVETTAWIFLGAASVALGVFSLLWPVWFPVAAGAFLCARRATRCYA